MMENSRCLNCMAEQADLDGICCKCGWNHSEQRPATEEEMREPIAKLNDAIAKMKKAMGGR